jgi:hypothetical protein
MTNYKSFEELWEKSESLYKNDITNPSFIVQEITAKLLLYRALHENKSIEEKDRAEAKFHLMGKILSAITHLSFADNINVFAALQATTNTLKIEQLENILNSKS